MLEKLKPVWAWIKKYLLAPLPVLLIVAGAIVLVVLGVKDLQIGGILAKLLGKKPDVKAVDVANSVPEHRVDTEGKIIPVGTPDDKGITQAVVVPIENPGLFSNPDTVKIQDPEKKIQVEVALPEGVKAKDVDKVIVVSPEVHVVMVKNTSSVKASDVDGLLAKYGKKH